MEAFCPLEFQQNEKNKLSKGKGAETPEDGLKFYSKTMEMPPVSGTGELSVLPVYEIHGAVSADKEIIDCEIETGGKRKADGGRILSSEVSAK